MRPLTGCLALSGIVCTVIPGSRYKRGTETKCKSRYDYLVLLHAQAGMLQKGYESLSNCAEVPPLTSARAFGSSRSWYASKAA